MEWTPQDEDVDRQELWLGLLVPPTALVIAAAFERSSFGHFLQRTFLSMPLHELGHAVTAWLLSVWAFPGPWLTRIGEAPGWGLTLVLVAAWIALAVHGHRTERSWLTGLGAALGLLQLSLRAVSASRAQAWITFGGDAGAMILGTLLMATFYSPPGSWAHRGWLRWGFLVIGAAAFVDPWSGWLRASHDFALIPFGENEGQGLSDASKLVDVYGWSEAQLLSRYTRLGWACLGGYSALWAGLGLWRFRQLP